MTSRVKRQVLAAARRIDRTCRLRRGRFRYEDFGYRRFLNVPGLESVPSWKRGLDVPELLSRHAVESRGVIQAGAHKGNEVELFLRSGFQRVLLIEANPELASGLRDRFRDDPRVFVHSGAVSDAEGACTLNLATGDAQSSSILDPTLHKKIYRGIGFESSVSVRATTIDTIVRESGFRPHDFNMIVLDIQGAEIMALRGAIEQLEHTDAVLSEFSNIELYNGSGTIADLRELLTTRGFHLAAEEMSWHPTWGDCFFVRRPLITMSDLGSNGRFANQIFQHAFLHVAAQRLGAVVQTPPWIGHELYGLAYAPLLPGGVPADADTRRPVIYEHAEGPECSNERTLEKIVTSLGSHPSVDVRGFFQDIAFFAPHRETLRSLYAVVEPWKGVIGGVIKELRSVPGPLTAVHLRRSDYGYGPFYRAPHTWYAKWLDGLSDPGPVYIASENPEPYRSRFGGRATFTAADFPSVPKGLRWLLDFEVLRHADHVAISNSSFSFMAAFLNPTEGLRVRPCVRTEGMVPFDPCVGPVVDRANLSPDQHQRLTALDAV